MANGEDKIFDQNLRTDGGEEEAEKEENSPSEGSNESTIDKTIRKLLGGRKPSERFGFGLASEKGERAAEEIEQEDIPEDVELSQLSQHIEDAERAADEYDEFRKEGEDFLQNVRNQVNASNAVNAEDTVKIYGRIAQEADALDVHEYEFAPNTGEHSFEGLETDELGLLDFLDRLDSEVQEFDGRAQERKDELKELEKREQDLEERQEELEKERKTRNERAARQRENEETRKLTDESDMTGFERRANEGRVEESLSEIEDELSGIYEQAEHELKKKQEYEDEAMDRQDLAEEAYQQRVSEVRDFFPDALDHFQGIVSRLDKLAGRDFEDLEEINARSENKSGKISNDGRNQVARAYADAVNSMARKAAIQYAQLDNAVSELEVLDDHMGHAYFDQIKKSGDFRDMLEDAHGADEFEEYVSAKLEESGIDYAGRDDIREIFESLESDHTQEKA